MITRNQLAAIAISILSAMPAWQVVAQENATIDRLDVLFTNAVSADNLAYVALRGEIVTNELAVQFLTAKCASRDLRSRIVARGMLEWATNSALCLRRQEILGRAVAGAARRRGDLLTNIQGDAFGVFSGLDKGLVEPSDELHVRSAVPFLLEVILKGPTEPEAGIRQRPIQGYEPSLWMRCFAAALVGGYEGEDVVLLLVEMLDSKAPAPLRACAATGLRRSKAGEAIEPLITGLSDANDDVRKSVIFALKELTGQDFGTDEGKYQDWWRENKAQFPKKP